MRTSPGTRGRKTSSLRPRVLKSTSSVVISWIRSRDVMDRSAGDLHGAGEPGGAGQGLTRGVESRVAGEGKASRAGSGGGEFEGQHDAGAVGAGNGSEMRAPHHQGAGGGDGGLDGARGAQ